MMLNKAEVLFMFDHVNDAQRRMMVESLLDRIIALEANHRVRSESDRGS